MSLSKRLGELRKQLGFTQAEFAEKLGVSISAYRTYEYGTRDPPASLLVLLVSQYDVVPAWLLKGQDSQSVAKILDVSKTEACFRYMDVFRKEHQLTLNRRQQAELFNAIFEHIDDTDMDDSEMDNLLLEKLK